jgi:phosphoglycerate kinase
MPFRSANGVMHDVIYAALTESGSLVSVAAGGNTSPRSIRRGSRRFHLCSTAGGAFLERMEGKKLPGVKALEG